MKERIATPASTRLVLELGATHTVNTTDLDMTDELMRITNDAGVDAVLDTTAIPRLLVAAAGALAIRGMLALVGAAAS